MEKDKLRVAYTKTSIQFTILREQRSDYTLQEKKLDKNSLTLHNAWSGVVRI